MVLATKGGVDPKLMLEILTNSAAKSGLIDFKAPYVFRRDFSPQFAVKWMDKDIGLMLDSGKELNVPLTADRFDAPNVPGGHRHRSRR